MRTWTDLKGRAMEASFIKYSGDKIVIKRADGRVFTLSPTIFSAADQKYLADLKKAVEAPNQTNAKSSTDNKDKLGKSFKTHLVPSAGNLEMIWVEPGKFMMGSPASIIARGNINMNISDEVQHQVTLTKGFYLGKYEVTQAQWEKVMGNNPSKFKGADRPVDQVSWTDAVDFCKKLTKMEKKAGRVPQGMAYQLPTESQWEYACRAGTTTIFSWGNSAASTQANFDNNIGQPRDVGQYAPNPWGFFDMHGNVWEWCADWYGDYPKGAVTDPTGPTKPSYRVLRGGSWYLDGSYLRSAGRGINASSYRYLLLGFRVGLRASK
jgi:sulfatase modifying factor 1